jgi:hypothetical protein
MINCQRLNNTASILLYIFKWPDAIVSNNGIVSKINESFRAQSITKDNITLVLKVVTFIFFLVGVNYRIDVVVGKVEKEIGTFEELINLLV